MTQVENKIVDAAVACIEEYGIQKTTIRRISEKAGMNVASINYYFRSKDALMEQVLSQTLDNAFQWSDFEYTEDMPLEQQLYEVFYFFSANALKYPKLAYAHLYDIISTGSSDTQFSIKLDAFLERLAQEVKRKRPELPNSEIRIALAQMAASTLLFFSVFANTFTDYLDVDLNDLDVRADYVRRIVDRLI